MRKAWPNLPSLDGLVSVEKSRPTFVHRRKCYEQRKVEPLECLTRGITLERLSAVHI